MPLCNYLDDRHFEQALQLLDMNIPDSPLHPYNVFVEDIARRIGYSNGKFNLDMNTIKYNNKIVLFDFERAGTIDENRDIGFNIPNIFDLIDKIYCK